MCESTGLPNSSKLVLKTLEYEGPLTYGDLAEEAEIPESTLDYAIRKLDEAGRIQRVMPPDARYVRYDVADD